MRDSLFLLKTTSIQTSEIGDENKMAAEMPANISPIK
jgi:hypothetical protein